MKDMDASSLFAGFNSLTPSKLTCSQILGPKLVHNYLVDVGILLFNVKLNMDQELFFGTIQATGQPRCPIKDIPNSLSRFHYTYFESSTGGSRYPRSVVYLYVCSRGYRHKVSSSQLVLAGHDPMASWRVDASSTIETE